MIKRLIKVGMALGAFIGAFLTAQAEIITIDGAMTATWRVVYAGYRGNLSNVAVLGGAISNGFAKDANLYQAFPYHYEYNSTENTISCQLQSNLSVDGYVRGALVELRQNENGDIEMRAPWIRYVWGNENWGVDMRPSGSFVAGWSPNANCPATDAYGVGNIKLGLDGETEPESYYYSGMAKNNVVVVHGLKTNLENFHAVSCYLGGSYVKGDKVLYPVKAYHETYDPETNTYTCQMQHKDPVILDNYIRACKLKFTQNDCGDVIMNVLWTGHSGTGDQLGIDMDTISRGGITLATGSFAGTGYAFGRFTFANGVHTTETSFIDKGGQIINHQALLTTVPYGKYEKLFEGVKLSEVTAMNAKAMIAYKGTNDFVVYPIDTIYNAAPECGQYEVGYEGFYHFKREVYGEDSARVTFQVQAKDGKHYGNALMGAMFVDLVQSGNDIYGCVYDARYLYHKLNYGGDCATVKSQNTVAYYTDEEDDKVGTIDGAEVIMKFSLRNLELVTREGKAIGPIASNAFFYPGYVTKTQVPLGLKLDTNLANFHLVRCKMAGNYVRLRADTPQQLICSIYHEQYDPETNTYTCQPQMLDTSYDTTYLRGASIEITQDADGNVYMTGKWVGYVYHGTIGMDMVNSNNVSMSFATGMNVGGYAINQLEFVNEPLTSVVENPLNLNYAGKTFVANSALKTVPYGDPQLLFTDVNLKDVVGIKAVNYMAFDKKTSFVRTPIAKIYTEKPSEELHSTGYEGFYFVKRTLLGKGAARLTFQVQGKDGANYNPPLMGAMFVDLIQVGNNVWGCVYDMRYIYHSGTFGDDCALIGTKNSCSYWQAGEDEKTSDSVFKFSLQDLQLVLKEPARGMIMLVR